MLVPVHFKGKCDLRDLLRLFVGIQRCVWPGLQIYMNVVTTTLIL